MKQIPVIAYDVLAVAESFAPRDHPKADTFFQHPYLFSYSREEIENALLFLTAKKLIDSEVGYLPNGRFYCLFISVLPDGYEILENNYFQNS
ncbi:hypothetical protein ACK4CS_15150 [Enterococcus gallinarum]|uniref:Uncharacterized protein n=1 Tax=Enterococcus gallinarum TaxID=1353 RepID=A0A376GXI4_ENTGA|nr:MULTISPECIES: hypothetical protein [Enterococcus]MDN3168383.1 hypothetical protein [Enterococcus faecalis]MDT2692005.1 hypothetical protein [Enterococcus gallinarum]STD73260.1 Uncharacterised protein [Enterococcus gallinarum]STD82110.1 Uncharacterised protein [Enterococcus gallinarum]